MTYSFLRGMAFAVGAVVPVLFAAEAVVAKTPGHEYCFHGTCHTVKTLEETRRLVGITTKLKASFYDDAKSDRYNPSNQTSSGEYFRADRPDNAASPIYPDGTKLLVWHPASGKALLVRVNNAGPYWGDRKLDLSRAAAERFGFRNSGVATVHVKVVEAPSKAEATYRRGRTYPPVKGYLGQFASVEAAAVGVAPTTTRLASDETPRPVAIQSELQEKAVAESASKLAAAKVVASAPIPLAPPKMVADLPASAKPKPVKLTMLDMKLASNVELEARKFLGAQFTSR